MNEESSLLFVNSCNEHSELGSSSSAKDEEEVVYIS